MINEYNRFMYYFIAEELLAQRISPQVTMY